MTGWSNDRRAASYKAGSLVLTGLREEPVRARLVAWLLSILILFAARAALPQAPGLEELHVPAPDFPTPQQPASAANPMAGAPSPGAAASMPRPNIPDANPGQSDSAAGQGDAWINSSPLTMSALRGKVVMIDFWEPTCINCIRTFPDNKKWWDRYHKYGFVIVGVEDPEFDIARPPAYVSQAVRRFGLPYPIFVDSQMQVWNEYQSRFWPNRYLIDAKGYIRYHVAGEGDDAEFEQAIQKLLKEAHPELSFPASDAIASDHDVMAPACGGPTTPEMYVGDWFGRGRLADPEGYHDGKTIDYKQQASVQDGQVVVSGPWETDRNGMIYRGKHKGEDPGADRVVTPYHARELYAVMNVTHGHPSRLYVMQDGKYLTAANKGVDVQIDGQGRSYIDVREPRMYYVVQNPEFGSHTLALYPTRSGFTLNSFTFGNNCQTDFAHS